MISKAQSSKKLGNPYHRINLNVPMIKKYAQLPKLIKILSSQVKDIIKNDITNLVNNHIFVITQQQCYVDISYSTVDGINKLKPSDLKTLLQKTINSYQIIPFQIDSTQQTSISHLAQSYICQQTKQKVYFIIKKQDSKIKILKYFQSIFSSKKPKKLSLRLQILQFDIQKVKQIEDIIKSIRLLITNLQNVIIKLINIDKCLIIISGDKQQVQICKAHINDFVDSNCLKLQSKNFKITEEQQKIIKKNKVLDTYSKQFGVKFQFKSFTAARTFYPNQNSQIQLLINPNILSFPNSTVLLLPKPIIKQIKQLQGCMSSIKTYSFYPLQQQKNIQKIIIQYSNQSMNKKIQIGILMPQHNRQKFIQFIINGLYLIKKQIKIYILQRFQQKLAINAFDNVTMQTKKWYAEIKGQKIYYTDQVCNKIQQAIKNRSNKLIITNDDLKISKITHQYDGNKGQIINITKGCSNCASQQDGKLVVFAGQNYFQINKSKINSQGLLTFAIFQINLQQYKQINLITNKQYKIGFQMVKNNKSKLNINESKMQRELIIKYPDPQQIDNFWNSIQKQINGLKVVRMFDVNNVVENDMKEIVNWCQLNNIIAKMNGKEIQVSAYDEAAITNLQKMISVYSKNSITITYPEYWQKQIKDTITLRNVPIKSEQFKKVQNNFKVGNIKKLQRVQNKILFQKYNSQRAFLSTLHGGYIRQLMLYHGTRANQPQLIYGDKEQSFNINYANMGSYGKGIYFAKNSQYSNTYCFTCPNNDKQMFNCLVLVGNSETYNGSQKLDTNFKDKAKKIRYDSVVDGVNQTIFVVFKNRRAYPLYLITY